MNIITCIKQVPASSNVQVDEKTGVLIRDGKNVKMNPYDLYALEASFFIKQSAKNLKVHAITMGPPSAKEVLKESLYMGADEATLLSDRRFAGADVLATSYTLSQMIDHIGNYKVIICGKQTTDGDTAQVGPEIAEFLSIPHVPYVKEIISYDENEMIVKSAYDGYEEITKVKLPCLLTIEKGFFVPRLPSYRRQLSFEKHEIKTVNLGMLKDNNPDHYGLFGSPTQVEAIFPPDKSRTSVRIEGHAKKLSKTISDVLKEHRFL
jgi:electron transfer flavoprotein beta subunit